MNTHFARVNITGQPQWLLTAMESLKSKDWRPENLMPSIPKQHVYYLGRCIGPANHPNIKLMIQPCFKVHFSLVKQQ